MDRRRKSIEESSLFNFTLPRETKKKGKSPYQNHVENSVKKLVAKEDKPYTKPSNVKINDGWNKYTFNGLFYTGFASSWYIDNQKYVDSYAYNEEIIADTSVSNSRLGDAMGETRSWYNDSNFAPNVDTSWIERGGNYGMGKNAGIFAYGGNMGYNIRMNGFRSVIVSG